MFKSTVPCASAGTNEVPIGHTAAAVCTTGGVFTFGFGAGGWLGHGSHGDEVVPCMVQGLGSMEVVMASAGA